ncbi:MAG TPA: cation transporter [Thiolapillus brandeum]|uniref:Cation transporter n=1 Tax=Thiolapillus brandeum TaxID=1076588 RepID=A0A7C5IYK4_9GAMM|nr:cation transporter [Thiolapillus brandeum]
MHHHHHHAPGTGTHNRAFAIGVTLNLGFVVVELVYGLLVGSLALIADAWHNLSDVLGLLLAWGAAWLAGRPPTPRRSYGYRRATILASLFSAMLLLSALGAIALEAVERFRQPAPIQGEVVIWVALVGVVINTATALMFLRGQKADLNIRGAFLHMAADAAVSLGVVAAGGVILATGWLWVDPALSLVIVVVIFFSTWGLLRESLALALDAVPAHIDPDRVAAYLEGLPEVTGIHDLHIWAMSTTEVALTVHLTVRRCPDSDAFLQQLSHVLAERFGIRHATIQIERDHPRNCALAAPGSL